MNIIEELKDLSRSHSMKDEELMEVFKTAKKVKGLILEIGCFRGISTIALALGSNQKVITVDPFIAHGETESVKQIFLNNIKKMGIEHLVNLRQCYSSELDFDAEISLLLIDGDHSYEGVKHDFEKFFPKVKKGGYVLLHDFHLKGIKQLFDEQIWSDVTNFEEFKIIKSLIVIKK